MRKTLLILVFSILFLSLYFTSSVHAVSNNYSKLSIESISNLKIHDDYQAFPLGNILFENVPFYIYEGNNNFLATQNVACVTCPSDATLRNLNISNPRTIWLLVNSSDSFTRFNNANFGSVYFNFSDTTTFRYDFIIGGNVREWLQSNKYGLTINTVSSMNSYEIWRGHRPQPNFDYPVVTDLLKIELPTIYQTKYLQSIKFSDESLSRVTSFNPLDPGLIIKGVTVESSIASPVINVNVSSNWSDENGWVPLDREVRVVVEVKDSVNSPVKNKNLDVSLVRGTGYLSANSVTTDDFGKASFVFTPGALGELQIKVSDGTYSSTLTHNVYRPKILIIPGHGASYNGESILKGAEVGEWEWFTNVAKKSWDSTIAMLEESGLVKGSTYDIAFYNWTRSIKPTPAVDARDRFVIPKINSLLHDMPSGQKVNILAHSFGGLVTRTLVEESNQASKVNRIMTFGTPHKGSSDAYFAWEGGVGAPSGDAFYRGSIFGLTNLMQFTGGLDSKAQTVRLMIPSVGELLPVYNNYLFSSTNLVFIQPNQYIKAKNYLLESAINISDFKTRLVDFDIAYNNVVSGHKNTINTIHVKPHNKPNEWEDGKPTGEIYHDLGDNTVSLAYAALGSDYDLFQESTHGDLPDSGILHTVNKFKLGDIRLPNGSVVPKRFVGLLVKSPAYVELYSVAGELISNSYDLQDNEHSFVYAEDIPDGLYEVRLTGTGNGEYSLFVNHADENVYQEIDFNSVINNGEQHSYYIYIGKEPTDSLQRFNKTTFDTLPGALVMRNKKPIFEFKLKIPEGKNYSYPELQTVVINGSELPFNTTDMKKQKTVSIQVSVSELVDVLDLTQKRQMVSIILPGKVEGLYAEGEILIPPGMLRNITE